ncbi:MAG: ACP S-malonyltransferase [Deltaproteobacteria bacterium]|jgi:[acyl-carrier-protein] S-malonyltransferase|nr:ACP S-malonyltransferase [Deltaproteobacteria bacterium]
MTKTAFLFPGQGGQFVGMGSQWAAPLGELSAILELADRASGQPISRLCLEGPLDELSKTVNLQPAILAVSLAAAKAAVKNGLIPSAAAGHSLGEFGALALAGVLDDEQAMTLVAKRAALMDRAASETSGAMSAILGLPASEVEAVCELARHEGQVICANFNTPVQTVISGEPRAVAAAARFAEMKGGKPIPLPVSGAFHSPLMKNAADAFGLILGGIEFKSPKFPVVPNALGQPVSDPVRLKELLRAQMTSPVLFSATVLSLSQLGVTEFIECWPKPYLGPMVRKNLPPDGPKATIKTAG